MVGLLRPVTQLLACPAERPVISSGQATLGEWIYLDPDWAVHALLTSEWLVFCAAGRHTWSFVLAWVALLARLPLVT